MGAIPLNFVSFKLASMAVLVSVIAALSGCSKKEEKIIPPSSESIQGRLKEGVKDRLNNPAKYAPTPSAEKTNSLGGTADKSVPLDNYVIVKGTELLYAYYAFSGAPLDYEKIAEMVSPAFNKTTDGFKRKDILKTLQPRVDEDVAKARERRYLRFDLDFTRVDKYDFERKGFSIRDLDGDDVTLYVNDGNVSSYKLRVDNASEFRFIPVADEGKAREIEALRTKYPSFKLSLYLFVTGSVSGKTVLTSNITRLELKDPKKNLVIAK